MLQSSLLTKLQHIQKQSPLTQDTKFLHDDKVTPNFADDKLEKKKFHVIFI